MAHHLIQPDRFPAKIQIPKFQDHHEPRETNPPLLRSPPWNPRGFLNPPEATKRLSSAPPETPRTPQAPKPSMDQTKRRRHQKSLYRYLHIENYMLRKNDANGDDRKDDARMKDRERGSNLQVLSI